MQFKSWVGHRLREGMLHVERISYPESSKRLVMFPWTSFKDTATSSRQRAYNLGNNLRTKGWRVTVVPHQLELEQRQRILRLDQPQILYIQKDRHKLNFPQLYDVPKIVFDIDDADFVDPKQKTQVIECCQGSDLVICGSKFIADFCRQYNSNTHIV